MIRTIRVLGAALGAFVGLGLAAVGTGLFTGVQYAGFLLAAWTVSWLREPTDHLRTGLEYTRATGNHLGADGPGTAPNTGGSMITFEVRYKF